MSKTVFEPVDFFFRDELPLRAGADFFAEDVFGLFGFLMFAGMNGGKTYGLRTQGQDNYC